MEKETLETLVDYGIPIGGVIIVVVRLVAWRLGVDVGNGPEFDHDTNDDSDPSHLGSSAYISSHLMEDD